jgi:hypothetical protein
MRLFYRLVAGSLAAQGRVLSLKQVRALVRREFETYCRPVLEREGWPVPETDEGRVLAMEICSDHEWTDYL